MIAELCQKFLAVPGRERLPIQSVDRNWNAVIPNGDDDASSCLISDSNQLILFKLLSTATTTCFTYTVYRIPVYTVYLRPCAAWDLNFEARLFLFISLLLHPYYLNCGNVTGVAWLGHVSAPLSALLASCCDATDPNPGARPTSARLVSSLLDLYPDLLTPLIPTPDGATVAVRMQLLRWY